MKLEANGVKINLEHPKEIDKAKDGIAKMVNPIENVNLDVQTPINQVKDDLENITGPVKRQM